MAWVYLILAGVCEIGWPVGLKLGWTENGVRPLWIGFAVLSLVAIAQGASGIRISGLEVFSHCASPPRGMRAGRHTST